MRSNAATVQGWVADLATLGADLSQHECIDTLEVLEALKAAATAAQARLAVTFAELVRDERVADGVPAAELDRGIGSEIALARHESPRACLLSLWCSS